MTLTGKIITTLRDMIERLEYADLNNCIKESFKDLIKYHHSYGTHLRNHYSLWDYENPLHKELEVVCKELGIEQHPDSYSHFLIEQMWCRLVLDNVDLVSEENIRDANKELIR